MPDENLETHRNIGFEDENIRAAAHAKRLMSCGSQVRFPL